MDTLHIKQLKARYRLTPSATDVRERLDGLLRELSGDALEAALAYVGVPAHEEICVREVHAPVRLRLSASDQALIEQWSMALAEYIQRAIEEGGSGRVVRYPSRINAFVDMATGVALDCYNRSWAWNQLGIAALDETTSRQEALEQLITALEREAQFIVPVLKQLATQGRLQALARQLGEAHWRRLARAALAAAGVVWTPGALARVMKERQLFPQDDHVVPRAASVSASAKAAILLDHSLLAQAVLAVPHVFAQPHMPLESLVALMILEVEAPMIYAHQQGLVDVMRSVAMTLQQRHPTLPGLALFIDSEHDQNMPAAFDDTGTERDVQFDVPAVGNAVAKQRRQNKDDAATAAFVDDTAMHDRRAGADNKLLDEIVPAVLLDDSAVIDDQRALPMEDELAVAAPVDDYPLPESNAPLETEFGGVLFFLKLIEQQELPQRIIAADCFETRAFKWVLYQLARSLVPLHPGDPVLFAFCGMAYSDETPWQDALPMTDIEAEWFAQTVQALVVVLRERLGQPEQVQSLLLDNVCRRSAQLIGDPGWLEVVFSLESVSTDIRRAALDLDPGYLPWLGQVVRFRYE